jgi:deferrochelatase/peroxidase EfeB
MSHSFITVVVPFDATKVADVETVLKEMGNPVSPAVRAKVDAIGTVHFMSLAVVPGDEDDDAQLILEVTADSSESAALGAIAAALEQPLKKAVRAAGIHTDATLSDLLRGHARTLGQSWWSTSGLPFDGTPGMTVRRILQERDLAAHIANLLDGLQHGLSPVERLERVREIIWSDGNAKWAFVPEPTPCLAGAPESGINPLVRPYFGDAVADKPINILAAWPTLMKLAATTFVTFLWPLVALFVLIVAAVWYFVSARAAMILAVLCVLLSPLAAAIVAILAYYRLRRHEQDDVPLDREPGKQLINDVMQHETYSPQNLLYSVSTLKPGTFRRLVLRFAFWSVGLVGMFCRPGFLGTNRVIHFARWLHVPGTDKMVFLSNYDGTWEGYVGDFVQNAAGAHGVTAIWSNCVEFPRTRDLIVGGNDRDRLVRWARRQQRPVYFWYSAYPDVTTDRVRTNAAIRQGLASAQSEADAADWLACFGSAPSLPGELQIPQIPALAFSGLGRFANSARMTITFSWTPRECRDWLKAMESLVAWGESQEGASVAVIGLAASALQRIGIPDDDLATFPVAYQQGMAAPNRARALGDEGDQAPDTWSWGGPTTNRADALVLLYAHSDVELRRVEAVVRAGAGQFHHDAAPTQWLQASTRGLAREAFGFVDGISQPRMRGTSRSQLDSTPPNDIVAPGELTLGYPDNLGRFPPTPSIAAGLDPEHRLPDIGPDPHRQRPEFSRNEATGRRDLGRNGTYLVVRQLEQDPAAFAHWLDEATTLTADSALPKDPVLRREMIAAKAIGRWPNGTSIVRYPDGPGKDNGLDLPPDNYFMFGEEDPGASRCPFGAHIRRANPRDGLAPGSKEQHAVVNAHRMFRVGRSYDADSGGKPGLLFMCVNADIERQFEFVQGSWLLNPNFSGLERETDPMLGHESGIRQLTVPTSEGPLRLRGLTEFVRMRGGGYFFLPGRSAYRFLATFGTQ